MVDFTNPLAGVDFSLAAQPQPAMPTPTANPAQPDFGSLAGRVSQNAAQAQALGQQAIAGNAPLAGAAKGYSQGMVNALNAVVPAVRDNFTANMQALSTIADAQTKMQNNYYVPGIVGHLAGMVGDITGNPDWKDIDKGYQRDRIQQAAMGMSARLEANKAASEYIGTLASGNSAAQGAQQTQVQTAAQLQAAASSEASARQAIMQGEHERKLMSLQGMSDADLAKAKADPTKFGVDPGMIKDEEFRRQSHADALQIAALQKTGLGLSNSAAKMELDMRTQDRLLNTMPIQTLQQLAQKAASNPDGTVEYGGQKITTQQLIMQARGRDMAVKEAVTKTADYDRAAAEASGKLAVQAQAVVQASSDPVVRSAMDPASMAGHVASVKAAEAALASGNPLAAKKILDDANTEFQKQIDTVLKTLPEGERTARKQMLATGDIADPGTAAKFISTAFPGNLQPALPATSIYADAERMMKTTIATAIEKNAHILGINPNDARSSNLNINDMMRQKLDKSDTVQLALKEPKVDSQIKNSIVSQARAAYVTQTLQNLAVGDPQSGRPGLDVLKPLFNGNQISPDYQVGGRPDIGKIYEYLASQAVNTGGNDWSVIALALNNPANRRAFDEADRRENNTAEAAAMRRLYAQGSTSNLIGDAGGQLTQAVKQAVAAKNNPRSSFMNALNSVNRGLKIDFGGPASPASQIGAAQQALAELKAKEQFSKMQQSGSGQGTVGTAQAPTAAQAPVQQPQVMAPDRKQRGTFWNNMANPADANSIAKIIYGNSEEGK